MCIKGFDYAPLISRFLAKNPSDNENTYKLFGIFVKFSNTIYIHLETFSTFRSPAFVCFHIYISLHFILCDPVLCIAYIL